MQSLPIIASDCGEKAAMSNRIELSITRRFSFAEAYEFGTVGAYERLVGRANFAVDPGASAQRGSTDLDKAPTDHDGLVDSPAIPRSGSRLIRRAATGVGYSPTATAAPSGRCSSS